MARTSPTTRWPCGRERTGYPPQEPSIFRGLTEQNILAILETLTLSAPERGASAPGTSSPSSGFGPGRPASLRPVRGERRRAEITYALVMSPRFMLLDEPFAGIDLIAVTDIQKIIFHLKERALASSSPTTTSVKPCALPTARTSSPTGPFSGT